MLHSVLLVIIFPVVCQGAFVDSQICTNYVKDYIPKLGNLLTEADSEEGHRRVNDFEIPLARVCYLSSFSGLRLTEGKLVQYEDSDEGRKTKIPVTNPLLTINCSDHQENNKQFDLSIPFRAFPIMANLSENLCGRRHDQDQYTITDTAGQMCILKKPQVDYSGINARIRRCFPQPLQHYDGQMVIKWANVNWTFTTYVIAGMESYGPRLRDIYILSNDYQNIKVDCIGQDAEFQKACTCLRGSTYTFYELMRPILYYFSCGGGGAVDHMIDKFSCEAKFDDE